MSKYTKIVSAMKGSSGRFFGLYTKSGEAINAQFLSETPCYVTVKDRNAASTRKLAKSSLAGFRLGSKVIGSA